MLPVQKSSVIESKPSSFSFLAFNSCTRLDGEGVQSMHSAHTFKHLTPLLPQPSKGSQLDGRDYDEEGKESQRGLINVYREHVSRLISRCIVKDVILYRPYLHTAVRCSVEAIKQVYLLST